MKKSKWMLTVALVVLFLFPVGALAEPITINWWHAHGGRLGELVNGIADGFNKSRTRINWWQPTRETMDQKDGVAARIPGIGLQPADVVGFQICEG